MTVQSLAPYVAANAWMRQRVFVDVLWSQVVVDEITVYTFGWIRDVVEVT